MEPREVAGWRFGGCCVATPGRRVGMTPYREPLNLTKRCEIKRGAQEEWVTLLSWRHNEV
jgi:hypothetical protein